MRAHEYEKQAAAEFAQAAVKAGYRAYLAEKGNYGFYTDDDGSRVVSFQFNGFFESSVGGNYVTDKPAQTGTGWRIADASAKNIRVYFDANPPHWAVRDSKWRLATLDDHLDRYQRSSKYEQVAA